MSRSTEMVWSRSELEDMPTEEYIKWMLSMRELIEEYGINFRWTHGRFALVVDDPNVTHIDQPITTTIWSAEQRLRDWIHTTPLSQCSMGDDTCPDWELAGQVARIALGVEK